MASMAELYMASWGWWPDRGGGADIAPVGHHKEVEHVDAMVGAIGGEAFKMGRIVGRYDHLCLCRAPGEP